MDAHDADAITRGAPPWLVSLVIHLILLLALALITTPAGSGLGKLVLTMGASDSESAISLDEFSISTDALPVDADSLIESEQEMEMEVPFEPIKLTDAPEFTPMPVGIGPALTNVTASSPMFGGRTGAMKKALLAAYGGTAATEDAVKRGLLWLKRNQNKRGHWSMQGPYGDGSHSENKTAATAMAMLAFLGAGHTHLSGDYTSEVDKAMRFLVAQQDRSGFMARDARDHERMYAQAQATIALCELYGMTNDSWLRPRAQLAVDFAGKSQSSQGGWRYEANRDADTSVTGWFLLALKSGQNSRLEVDGSVVRNISDYLDSAASFDGAAYSYQPRGRPTESMTAEGLLCRQYLGWERDHLPLVRGVEALSIDYPFNINDRNVYYWYYATQVLHHFGGPHWRLWNEEMRVQLPAAQVKGGREDGSWAPQSDEYGSFYGRLYTTCMSIYCLEVYYRHLPLYKSTD